MFDAAEQYKDGGAYSFACWLAARADVSRSDAGSRPLDLGRDQRLANGDQWIGLWVRDRGCVVPRVPSAGSLVSRPSPQVLVPGGRTDLDNLTHCQHDHASHSPGGSVETRGTPSDRYSRQERCGEPDTS